MSKTAGVVCPHCDAPIVGEARIEELNWDRHALVHDGSCPPKPPQEPRRGERRVQGVVVVEGIRDGSAAAEHKPSPVDRLVGLPGGGLGLAVSAKPLLAVVLHERPDRPHATLSVVALDGARDVQPLVEGVSKKLRWGLAPDGSVVWTLRSRGRLQAWSPRDIESPPIELGRLRGVRPHVVALAGGVVAACGAGEAEVALWSTADGTRRQTAGGGTAPVTALAGVGGPGGENLLLIGRADGEVSVWDATHGHSVGRFAVHREPVAAVAGAWVDGTLWVVSAARDARGRLCEAQVWPVGSPGQRISLPVDEGCPSAAWGFEDVLVVGDSAGGLWVVDPRDAAAAARPLEGTRPGDAGEGLAVPEGAIGAQGTAWAGLVPEARCVLGHAPNGTLLAVSLDGEGSRAVAHDGAEFVAVTQVDGTPGAFALTRKGSLVRLALDRLDRPIGRPREEEAAPEDPRKRAEEALDLPPGATILAVGERYIWVESCGTAMVYDAKTFELLEVLDEYRVEDCDGFDVLLMQIPPQWWYERWSREDWDDDKEEAAQYWLVQRAIDGDELERLATLNYFPVDIDENIEFRYNIYGESGDGWILAFL